MAEQSILLATRRRRKASLREIAETKMRVSAPAAKPHYDAPICSGNLCDTQPSRLPTKDRRVGYFVCRISSEPTRPKTIGRESHRLLTKFLRSLFSCQIGERRYLESALENDVRNCSRGRDAVECHVYADSGPVPGLRKGGRRCHSLSLTLCVGQTCCRSRGDNLRPLPRIPPGTAIFSQPHE